jgi:hypothetical protein
MHRRIAAIIALLALSTAAAMPTAASAAARRRPVAKAIKAPTANQVLKNCTSSNTGYLSRPYSVRVLKQARKKVRGDIAEYTGCFDAVKTALRRAKSRIVVGIRARSGGRYVAGQIVLRDKRNRVVDAVGVRAGKRVNVRRAQGPVQAPGRPQERLHADRLDQGAQEALDRHHLQRPLADDASGKHGDGAAQAGGSGSA